MSWRTVVISSSSKLDYQMGFMTVRGDDIVKVHLSELEMLIIESTSVSLTAALLAELTKRKIKVIFCDEKRNPSSELIPYYGSHDSSAKIRTQVSWLEETRKAVWTEIVTEKIRKQAELLSYFHLDEANMLYGYIDEIQFDDETNREGHAAKVYFNALFGMDFSRSIECNINTALNYGYSIILSSFNRCVVSNGYITQLGLFHDNMFNPYNLSSDLMEPFRPLVDLCVKNMNLKKFEHEEKMELLRVLQMSVQIGSRSEFVNNAIKIYARSVFDAINDNDPGLVKFYSYEL